MNTDLCPKCQGVLNWAQSLYCVCPFCKYISHRDAKEFKAKHLVEILLQEIHLLQKEKEMKQHIEETPYRKFWYIACYSAEDNTPSFARKMFEVYDLEDVYSVGGTWFDENFPGKPLINDYAFLAEDYNNIEN